MQPAIEIKNLTVRLGGHTVIKNLSIDLPTGGIIGLIGPNGAGKTTLIRSIVGRQKVSLGQINIFGQKAGSAKLRKDIGYMTQAPAVYPDLTVRENVRYFASMTGQSKKYADEIIEKVELSKQNNQLVSKLSGGQRSRVSLAVSLIGNPKLLVLDEPTVGLDPILRKNLWELFNKLAGQDCTILVSSHVMDEANHCKSLLLLREGKVLAYGTAKDLCEQTHSKSVEESFIRLVGEKE
jgi:ABC-2 type transport system ATP-binding protein